MADFTNPVLSGCYPDPSVVRVGDEYFLVTSTFEYFPALPVFRSTDLVTWEQIGHAIDRPDQIDLSTVTSSGGLFAPTIRFYDGTFYIANTLVHGSGRQGNFLITATNPAGPWSDPIWVEGAPGIDPSIMFDVDGRAWFCGTQLAEPGLWEGQTDVWLRELDLTTLRLVGPRHLLWRGALVGARWAEGPHLYRIGGYYYLLAAEGGTERNHAISVARSSNVTGPYVGDPANPVLTHRALGLSASIIGVGHADLVETVSGQWAAVLLATRAVDGVASTLGRETNVVPVVWEEGWPVFAPGTGQVLRANGASRPAQETVIDDDFDSLTLDLAWNLVRTSPDCRYSLDKRLGWLRLPVRRTALSEVDAPAFVGRRQQHLAATVTTLMDFAPRESTEWAGLAIRQSEDAHLILAVAGSDSSGRRLVAVKRCGGVDQVLAQAQVDDGLIDLRICIDGFSAALEFTVSGVWTTLATTTTSELGSLSAGGFLGVWMGAYATSHGHETTTVADFDWIRYQGHDPKF